MGQDLTRRRHLKEDPGELVRKALGKFLKHVEDKFEEIIAMKKKQHEGKAEEVHDDDLTTKSKALFQLLMKADHMSVRQYLGS